MILLSNCLSGSRIAGFTAMIHTTDTASETTPAGYMCAADLGDVQPVIAFRSCGFEGWQLSFYAGEQGLSEMLGGLSWGYIAGDAAQDRGLCCHRRQGGACNKTREASYEVHPRVLRKPRKQQLHHRPANLRNG